MSYLKKHTSKTIMIIYIYINPLVIFHIAMEKSTIFKFGKPSISIRVILYHGYVSLSELLIDPGRPWARSMLKHADIVLLDEPTNHLDQEGVDVPEKRTDWLLVVVDGY